jgi:hypothetical protein
MLILLDNVDGVDEVRPLLPGVAGCPVIITSPRRLTALEGLRLVDLEPLDVSGGVAMLAAIVGAHRVEAEPRLAERLVEMCGGLPLAVRVAGATLAARPHWMLAHLVRRLSPVRSRLDELATGDLDVRHSLRRGCRIVGAGARDALGRLAVSAIGPFTCLEAASHLGVREDTAQNLLEVLADARLLTVRAAVTDVRHFYDMHSLVRLFAREQLVRRVIAEVAG